MGDVYDLDPDVGAYPVTRPAGDPVVHRDGPGYRDTAARVIREAATPTEGGTA